jgi:Flp pilus assembly protein TadB
MAVLVGDRERDRAAQELQRHYREGRLTTEELAQRLETALRARSTKQLGSSLKGLPARWRTDATELRETLHSPVRAVRNAAILAATAVLWLFWSGGLFVAFVAWLAANGPSLGALVVFPVLWFAVSWLLWTGSRRRRARR